MERREGWHPFGIKRTKGGKPGIFPSLALNDFVLTVGPGQNRTIQNSIFVRFQQVPPAGNSGGSDVGVPTGTPETPIPEPASMFLLGTDVLGVFGAARRKLKMRS